MLHDLSYISHKMFLISHSVFYGSNNIYIFRKQALVCKYPAYETPQGQ